LKTKCFNFAIIGGGLAATAMLTQLIAMMETQAAKKLLDPSRMVIQVFNKGDIFGPGFPHSDNVACPFHITNMCASEMGIINPETSRIGYLAISILSQNVSFGFVNGVRRRTARRTTASITRERSWESI
jgi:uncharacterized NAD(P)/FAD-binding protein YdhS